MAAFRKLALALALAVVVGGVAVAYSNGIGPFGSSGEQIEEPESRGDVFELGENGSVVLNGSSGEMPPITMRIKSINDCGQTCREISARVGNEMEEEATNVTVYTRIYAGNGTDGYRVWASNRRIGKIPGDFAEHTTDRVELGWREVPRVSAQDGWVTIETTVESDQATVTFVAYRKVLAS